MLVNFEKSLGRDDKMYRVQMTPQTEVINHEANKECNFQIHFIFYIFFSF